MEAATYNWYDQEDSLICTGRNLTVSPEVSSHYRLEVIADEDGFKSYDDVTVNVRQYFISSISPNPASNSFVLSYNADSAASAYIIMIQQNGYAINSHILNTNQHNQTITLANLPTGVYNIVLVCDGNIYDAKTITVY